MSELDDILTTDGLAPKGAGKVLLLACGADCGTGGELEAACAELGVAMVAGPHCYSFFEGNDTFAARNEMTKFYLTDLDRHPELRDMYFGNYTGLVYQAQIKDPVLVEMAKGYAQELGLTFEYRFTGYGDLDTALREL